MLRKRREGPGTRELRILRARVLNKSGRWDEWQITRMRDMIEDILRVNPHLAVEVVNE